MTDTQTVAGESDQPFFKVDYEIEVLEELPEGGRLSSGPGRSVLQDQIDHVLGDETLWNKWVRIGRYERKTAAPAARNVLRQRHGDTPAVEGWRFECRRIDNGATGLFVKYSPSEVIEGAKAEHNAQMKARKEKLAKQAAARKVAEEKAKVAEEKAKAAASGNGGSAPVASGLTPAVPVSASAAPTPQPSKPKEPARSA